jgi:hypothetical protein
MQLSPHEKRMSHLPDSTRVIAVGVPTWVDVKLRADQLGESIEPKSQFDSRSELEFGGGWKVSRVASPSL